MNKLYALNAAVAHAASLREVHPGVVDEGHVVQMAVVFERYLNGFSNTNCATSITPLTRSVRGCMN